MMAIDRMETSTVVVVVVAEEKRIF